jgi:hypothetical protein
VEQALFPLHHLFQQEELPLEQQMVLLEQQALLLLQIGLWQECLAEAELEVF